MAKEYKPNEQQQQFIDAPINAAIRVLAGPGSGKTASLTHRIKKMIESGVHPDSILAVTFSRDMAKELGERAVSVEPSVNTRQICTIHATAFRILIEEGLMGEGNNRLNPPGSNNGFLFKKNAKLALEQSGLAEVGYKEFLTYVGMARFNAIRNAGLANYYQQIIEANGGITKNVPWKYKAHLMLSDATVLYGKLLRKDRLIEFSEMMPEVEWLFQDQPSVLAKYQARYQYVMVDEAQDTSRQAMRILTLLAAPQNYFTAVGDVDQTIYTFAGADPIDNMWEGFEKRFPDCLTIKLETNYRSTQKIVGFTNQSIAANYTEETLQYRKNLVARPNAEEGKDITYNIYNTINEEMTAVAELVEKQVNEQADITSGDIFVCGRTRAQLAYLYGPLFRMKIPFIDKAGGSFWNSAHIQDLMAYLKLSANPADDEAFLRIYNKASVNMKQPFDLTDRASGKLVRARGAYVNHRWLGKAFVDQCGGSYVGISRVYDRKFQPGIADLQDMISGIRACETTVKKVDYIVDRCLKAWWAMEDGLEGDENSGGRLDDFATVADLAAGYETLGDFFKYLAEMEAAIKAAAEGDESKVVILSTIHRLKGLERPIVHVTGVMDGLLPHASAMGLVGGYKNGSTTLPTSNSNTMEDERRLFFVAVSRAKLECHLTGCRAYQNRVLTPSQFAMETGVYQKPDETLIDQAIQEAIQTVSEQPSDYELNE